ncbi:MAG TPA: glycoside hydrolase family 6 protein, partial [Herpetosiphonaceae bacterium]
MANHSMLRHLLVVGTLLATLVALATPTLASVAAKPLDRPRGATSEFYVPKPNHGALKQIADLTSQGRKADADLIRELIDTPSSAWVTGGSPKKAEQEVRQITHQAAGKKAVPVLVLYNIPFRDCAQYSAGGATSVAEYEAWIDGVVRGIQDREAYIILEPDGLGIIPWYTTLDGQLEWCQPQEANPATAAAERFEMMNYAVDALSALPNTRVYLDATHGGWLNVGEITDRLLKAGVQNADGFFLNASNYQWTENLIQYGTWVSSCIAYVTQINPSGFGDCGNQYWSGGPANNWQGVALDPALIWSDDAQSPNANTAGINSRYDLILGNVQPTTHFVLDTSRNGQGPWTPTQSFPDPQTWCNPPARGLGLRPTTDTGN